MGFSRIPAETRHGDMGLIAHDALCSVPNKLRRSGQRASRAPVRPQFVIPAKRSGDRIKRQALQYVTIPDKASPFRDDGGSDSVRASTKLCLAAVPGEPSQPCTGLRNTVLAVMTEQIWVFS